MGRKEGVRKEKVVGGRRRAYYKRNEKAERGKRREKQEGKKEKGKVERQEGRKGTEKWERDRTKEMRRQKEGGGGKSRG